MRPLLRSPPTVVALALVVIAMLAIGFVPLFDGPGYESALAAGLLVPSSAAIATALVTSATEVQPFDAFCRGVAIGGVLAAAAFATTLVHGLRAGFCDAASGSALFALGPGVGALLAGAWGSVAGELARSRKGPFARRALAVALALAAPLATIVLSIVRFSTSPMIFAYDPFVGYFSGTIYDTVIDASGLLTYRAGSAATLFAAFVAALHLGHDDRGRVAYQAIGRPGLLVLGAMALVGSGFAIANGPRLGHWQTPESIARALGAAVEGTRCEVVYARSIRAADAERFARECDAHVAQGERWFDAKGPPKIKAYLFADAAQKGQLMGASDTLIAKPWRREVYVQALGYPHPVLGHEIMHVLAGGFAKGPFKVPGALFGALPNAGLIEGVAVAAAPREGDLVPAEWAKAMKDLGLLPPLARLFGAGFLAESSATAYTVSGAFVEWVKDRFGVKAVEAWYGGATIDAATGSSLADLERAWHDDLDKITLPEAARAEAKARFDRPAIFGRRCPHTIDGCKQRASRLAGAGDDLGALGELARVTTLDAGDAGARLSIASSDLRLGRVDDARRELEAIASDERLTRATRDRALEQLGDVAFALGETDQAVAKFREVASRAFDEDQLRNLDVKIAATKDLRARAALAAFLVGAPGERVDKVYATELVATWAAAAPRDGLPPYLLGRQLVAGGRFAEGAQRIDAALAAGLSLPRVQIEAERLRLVAACALGDGKGAERFASAYAAHVEVGRARREWAAALLARCAGEPGSSGR